MSSRTQYVAVETLISMAINAALSIGFVFLVFHGLRVIPAAGSHGVIVDMAPQTFMVTLMSCLVPALLTRSRHAAGRLAWHSGTTRGLISHICLRAAVLAVLATIAVVAVSWIVLPHLLPNGIAFVPLVVCKALFGMALAAAVTPWAIARVIP
jgi:hypothetical protein